MAPAGVGESTMVQDNDVVYRVTVPATSTFYLSARHDSHQLETCVLYCSGAVWPD